MTNTQRKKIEAMAGNITKMQNRLNTMGFDFNLNSDSQVLANMSKAYDKLNKAKDSLNEIIGITNVKGIEKF